MRGCSQTSWSSCSSAPRWCLSRRAGARTWLFVTGKWKWVSLLLHGGHVCPASFSDPTLGFHLPVLWQDMLNCFASPFDVDEMLLSDHKQSSSPYVDSLCASLSLSGSSRQVPTESFFSSWKERLGLICNEHQFWRAPLVSVELSAF